jgi:hypothetical protein
MWAKFDGMDLKCICDEHHRKCEKSDVECKEYIVKFIEIDRNDPDEVIDNMTEKIGTLSKDMKKFQSEISRSIRKFKIK